MCRALEDSATIPAFKGEVYQIPCEMPSGGCCILYCGHKLIKVCFTRSHRMLILGTFTWRAFPNQKGSPGFSSVFEEIVKRRGGRNLAGRYGVTIERV